MAIFVFEVLSCQPKGPTRVTVGLRDATHPKEALSKYGVGLDATPSIQERARLGHFEGRSPQSHRTLMARHGSLWLGTFASPIKYVIETRARSPSGNFAE